MRVLAACGLTVLIGTALTADARLAEKQVIVTVMNLRTGQPVSGVTAAVLSIKEDGTDREIVKVEPATAPMSVILLADNTTAFASHVGELRATARAFFTSFFGAHSGSTGSLWTFGAAAVPVSQFQADSAKLVDESGKLRPVDLVMKQSSNDDNAAHVSESNLIDGVYDASKALGKRTETRRVIVSFNAATPLEKSKPTRQQVAAELQKADATWFAVTFADGGSSSPMRDSMMTEVLPYSGGLRLTVQDVSKLEPAVKAIAEILATQYVVTYNRASGSPKELTIEVKGEGVRAFYPRWAPK